MFDLARDIRSALRGLRRSPVFAITSLTIFAVAIGAVVSLLAVIDCILVRPLPVAHQEQLVFGWKEDRASGFAHFPFSFPSAQAIGSQLTTASDFATIDYNGAWPLSAVEGDRGFQLPTGAVSGHFFQLLGVRAVAGRLFVPADDAPNGPRVIVIGEALWRSKYGADPKAVGAVITLAGVPHTIIGVVPTDFAYPRRAVAWTPMRTWPTYNIDETAVTQDIVARLKPGRTIAEFAAELEAIRARTPQEQIFDFKTHHVVVRSFAEEITGDLRPTLLLLGLGAAVLLIVAAANAGGLALVRTGEKMSEIAIRMAIGGGRGRTLRAALLEHGLLLAGGAALGIALAWAAIRGAGSLLPSDLPRSRTLSLGLMPLIVGTALGIAAGLLAALAPAVALLRADLGAALRAGGRSAVRGWGGHPARRVLVASQLTLAVAAVSGAGLLLRTLERLRAIDVGFEPERLLFVESTAGWMPDTVHVHRLDAIDRMTSRLAAVPGVDAAAANFSPPFVGAGGGYSKMRGEGQSDAEIANVPMANREAVTPDYFKTMGMRLLRGRFLQPADREGAPDVVVINESLARYLFPGQDPIGKRIGYAVVPNPPWWTVVGVVADTRYNELKVPMPSTYVPYRQTAEEPWYFPVRLAPGVRPAAVVPALAQAIHETIPGAALLAATPMAALLGQPLATTTAATILTAIFGALTLALAAIGLYGVLSSYVVQRTREIGVRMALGADPGAVRRLVARQGLGLIVFGIAAGLAASAVAGLGLRGFLYEVTPADPVTLLYVALLLGVVGLIAVMVPARRATRIDPASALRAE